MEFDMVMLFVRDMTRSLEFYVNLFGFEISDGRTIFEASKDMFVVLEGYDVKLALHLADDVVTGGFKIVFNVESVDEFKGFLEDRGVKYEDMGEVAPGLYLIDVRDPDGHILSFVGPK